MSPLHRTLVLGFCTAVLLTSCRAEPPPITGSRLLPAYDYRACDSLNLRKHDGVTGDRWSARLEKRTEGAQAAWWILGSEPVEALSDRRANSSWVEHLLDALGTLKVDSIPDPVAEPAFGLKEPLWRLQARCGSVSWELRIGDIAGNARSGSRFARLNGAGAVAASGSAFGLLGRNGRFEDIRHPWVLAAGLDDVVLARRRRADGKTFQWERRPGGWTGQDGKSLDPSRAENWLRRVLHVAVVQVVEPPGELESRFRASRPGSVTLEDRLGRRRELWLGELEGRWLALSTDRPGAVFVVGPESALLLSDEPAILKP
ncbi:MAG: DUF4340 domain-containing protein [Bdellovibrionales bacterium]|nr:DUF4340 domain-containing protein [Bdellovibrionales bacterium]